MATVVDAARPSDELVQCANLTYQKGNDEPNTPNPTWTAAFHVAMSVADPGAVVPTFINMETFWYDSTPATVRF